MEKRMSAVLTGMLTGEDLREVGELASGCKWPLWKTLAV